MRSGKKTDTTFERMCKIASDYDVHIRYYLGKAEQDYTFRRVSQTSEYVLNEIE